uniref:GIY-YIG endonuclease n=1 Tax=Juglanconis juglandina TaxID=1940567 RepID=A0A291LIY7_9PEZI|nr:GIY-YIG endonuclease [Juglanconis juglandina]
MPEYIYINNVMMLNVNTKIVDYSLAYKRLHKKYSHFSVNHSFFYNTSVVLQGGLRVPRRARSINIRYFSTSVSAPESNIKEKNNTASSVYKNIYEGRGVPKPEPFWVKSNRYPISMFGASWGSPYGARSDFPIVDPKIYHHIIDPYHNRKKIHELSKGLMVVYIWTYTPKAFCLVGSSSNSVERILNYFRPKSLLKESRRAMEFFRDYGFKNVDLYIIPLNPKEYTINDMKSLEAYYIKELYTPLNVQREVYISPLQDTYQFIKHKNLKSISKSAVPVYVFKKDNLKKVLYVFSSLTKLKKEFQINISTLNSYINNEGNYYLDLFYFTTKLPLELDLENLIELEELMDLKTSVLPKRYFGRTGVKLINIKDNSVIVFKSKSDLINYIKLQTEEGVGYSTINKYVKSGDVLRDQWLIEDIESINSTRSIKEDLNKSIHSIPVVSENCPSPDKDIFIVEDKSTYKVNISVEITDITTNAKFIFKSLTEAAKHIKLETGKGTPVGLKYALDKEIAYLNIYLVKEVKESLKLEDLKTNEIKYFSTLKEVANWINEVSGDCSYTGLHWSYKNKSLYKKRFAIELVNKK